MNSTQDYNHAIHKLVDGIHDKYKKWGNKAKLEYRRTVQIRIIPGRKYDKIVRDNSVWGFVVKEDGIHKGTVVKMGDVLKAAHWTQPAKHVRGSIFEPGNEWYNWTGPEYLHTRKVRLADAEVDN